MSADNHANNKPTRYLDAKGFLCPMPVLRTRKALDTLESGAILAVEATDPKSFQDIPLFCEQAGHALIEKTEVAGHFFYLIRKG